MTQITTWQQRLLEGFARTWLLVAPICVANHTSSRLCSSENFLLRTMTLLRVKSTAFLEVSVKSG